MPHIEKNCHYTPSHEWIRTEEDLVTMGLSDYAQEQLGDIVYVELPEVGDSLTAGQPLGVVESVKTLSDLNAPISGEVVERNENLIEQPELLNAEPYQAGWMLKIRPNALKEELNDLMDAESYGNHCADLDH